MDAIVDFLLGYGYWGMFIAAFLAGSIFPLSSETIILGLWAAGLDPWLLIIYGSLGNILGSMLNYGIGRLGKLEWLERWFHVDETSIHKAEKFMGGRGALMGFFCFIPVIGDAISVVLGLTRANIFISVCSIALGKLFRYWLLLFGANAMF